MIRPPLSNLYEAKFIFLAILKGISVLLIAGSNTAFVVCLNCKCENLRNFEYQRSTKNSEIM